MKTNNKRINAYLNVANSTQKHTPIEQNETKESPISKKNIQNRYDSQDNYNNNVKNISKVKNEQNVQSSDNDKSSFVKSNLNDYNAVNTNNIDPSKPISDYMERYGMIKVTKPEDKKSLGGESVYRRVAKFLLLIGIDEAAKIIPHLTKEQIEKIVPEIASIRSVDDDEATVILAEFKNLVDQSRHTGGVNTAREILEKAFGKTRADEMIQKAVVFPEGKPFDYLQELDVDRLAVLLKDESLPIRALVLSFLKPKLSASYINLLEQSEKTELIKRLAKLQKISPDIIKRVDASMHEKLQSINTQKANSIDGRGALASILKKMTSSSENSILSSLAQSNPELAQDIKNRLFTTEDFFNCDDKYLQKKLQHMMDMEIAYIIADKDETFRNKILKNVSQGRKQLILDEEKMHKPMLKREVEDATNIFMTNLRRAWEKGELVILNKDDEVYV